MMCHCLQTIGQRRAVCHNIDTILSTEVIDQTQTVAKDEQAMDSRSQGVEFTHVLVDPESTQSIQAAAPAIRKRDQAWLGSFLVKRLMVVWSARHLP